MGTSFPSLDQEEDRRGWEYRREQNLSTAGRRQGQALQAHPTPKSKMGKLEDPCFFFTEEETGPPHLPKAKVT